MIKKDIYIYPQGNQVVHDLFKKIIKIIRDREDTDLANTVVLLVDDYAVELIEKEYFSFYGKKVLAYIIELNYKTISLIKIADFVIYQDEKQREIAEMVMGYSIPSEILPLPCYQVEQSKNQFHSTVLYTENQLSDPDIKQYLEVPGEKNINSKIVTLLHKEKDYGPKDLYFANGEEVIAKKFPGKLGYKIIGDMAKQEDISIKIANRDKTVIYYTLRGNLINFLMSANGFFPIDPELKKNMQLSVEEFQQKLSGLVKNVAGIVKYSVIPDRFTDLNIISGKKLKNKFVFSVCYRNQPRKIFRCINSICEQNKAFDYGIAVVDDASSDDSSDKIREILKKNVIDHIIVRNRERKFASRNFYNVIHHIVDNNESYIIELDGDDYLFTPRALEVLNKATKDGAEKTIGNLRVDNGRNIKSAVFERERLAVDFTHPRNISKCAAWYHLRMTKKSVLMRVEIEHFLERDGKTWLRFNHDSTVHSRAIDIAKNKVKIINEEIYAYDISGDAHDILDLVDEFEHENWSYGTFFLDNPYLFQTYIPLFEEPQKIPSKIMGKTLEDNPYFSKNF